MTDPTGDALKANAAPAPVPHLRVTLSTDTKAVQDIVEAARGRISVLEEALKRIVRWQGEFPETGKFWDNEKTRPISYGSQFGSNGERDFMRDLAKKALEVAPLVHLVGWQDISTAPKNTKVLAAYRNEAGNWRTVTACYHTQLDWSDEYGDHEQEFAPEDWYEENDSSEVIYPCRCQPTHWQPLPAPPATSASEVSE